MRDLRDFIEAVETAWEHEPHIVSTDTSVVEEEIDVAARLSDFVFKLRAHSEPLNESFDADYSLGVEAGCEMAAEMIENLIRQLLVTHND